MNPIIGDTKHFLMRKLSETKLFLDGLDPHRDDRYEDVAKTVQIHEQLLELLEAAQQEVPSTNECIEVENQQELNMKEINKEFTYTQLLIICCIIYSNPSQEDVTVWNIICVIYLIIASRYVYPDIKDLFKSLFNMFRR